MKKVRSLAHLIALAQDRRAVISRNYGPLLKPMPAAFVIGWTGRMIHSALQKGVYVYDREKK